MEGAESASDSEEVGSGIVATKKAQRKIQMSEPNRAEFEAITTEEWSNFIKACGSKKRLSVYDAIRFYDEDFPNIAYGLRFEVKSSFGGP